MLVVCLPPILLHTHTSKPTFSLSVIQHLYHSEPAISNPDRYHVWLPCSAGSSSSTNIPLIVGSVIAAVIFSLAICFLSALIVLRRRRNKTTLQQEDQLGKWISSSIPCDPYLLLVSISPIPTIFWYCPSVLFVNYLVGRNGKIPSAAQPLLICWT